MMGRQMTKEERERLMKRIVELKDDYKVDFMAIAQRLGKPYYMVINLYHEQKGEVKGGKKRRNKNI